MNKLSLVPKQPDTDTEKVVIADLVVLYLQQIGIEYVFGVAGGVIEPMYDALARSERRGGPRLVTARHETGAAFMADGYARESGKIGVCLATSGPGATNLITGVACAYDNSIPMLVITGQPPLPAIGKRAFQESTCTGINVLGMFEHCTRYNSLISHPDQVEIKLTNALARAWHSPRGPVHLSIPVDVLRSRFDRGVPSYNLGALLKSKPSLIDDEGVQALKAELKGAKRVVFFIGNESGEAIDSIMRLAELTQARFVTAPDAKGLIDPRHPLYRGVFGFGGHHSAAEALRDNTDLVVAFGTGFGELSSSGWCDSVLNTNLVHIDRSEENLMRSPMARLHVRGRIRTICERLVRYLQLHVPDRDHAVLQGLSESRNPHVALREPHKVDSNATPIKPQRLMKELSLRCPPHTRFLADAGNSIMWAVHYLQPRNRRDAPSRKWNHEPKTERRTAGARWLRVTVDFAPMGWAIGASIGIACANPKCPVVCITGDGSYLMSGQEITVAVQEQLPVVFVVLNDSAYGMVMHGQRLAGAEPVGFELPNVDYRLFAEAVGATGHVIHSPEDLAALDFDSLSKRPGPTILDVRIDREEVPPMSSRMKSLGTI